jgi:putative transposase
MKQVFLIKLVPTSEQHAALLRTLEAFNAACNQITAVAFTQQSAHKMELQHLTYYAVRQQFGLSAQMAIRAIAKVSDAYKLDLAVRPHFRPHGAMPYDDRILSFPRVRQVSLLTLDGRVEVPYRLSPAHATQWDHVRGQADLLYRKASRTFFLALTIDRPEPEPAPVADFLGVDLGVVTLVATSDSELLNQTASPVHAHVNVVRARYSRMRQKRQRKGTRSATRLLRKRSGRERRFVRDTNHCLSKALVQTAQQGTARGLALDDLKGIRERIRARGTVTGKRHRRVLHSWAFRQLRAFIAYKAALAGVRVVLVNPAYTSQTCSRCGHRERANRRSQARFLCVGCGFAAHAAANIRRAAVIPPHVAPLAG